MTTVAHSGGLNPPNPARGKNRTKPPVAPHGIGQATGAMQHAYTLATSSSSSGGTRKRRAKSTGSAPKKRRKSKSSLGSKLVKGTAAAKKAMSAIRALRGKSKGASASA